MYIERKRERLLRILCFVSRFSASCLGSGSGDSSLASRCHAGSNTWTHVHQIFEPTQGTAYSGKALFKLALVERTGHLHRKSNRPWTLCTPRKPSYHRIINCRQCCESGWRFMGKHGVRGLFVFPNCTLQWACMYNMLSAMSFSNKQNLCICHPWTEGSHSIPKLPAPEQTTLLASLDCRVFCAYQDTHTNTHERTRKHMPCEVIWYYSDVKTHSPQI